MIDISDRASSIGGTLGQEQGEATAANGRKRDPLIRERHNGGPSDNILRIRNCCTRFTVMVWMHDANKVLRDWKRDLHDD